MTNMKKLFNTVVSVVFCIAVCSPVLSYSAESVSWEDCVKEAIANNPTLRAKRLAMEQSEYEYKDAFNTYFPKIGLSHSYSRSGAEDRSASDSWSAGISAGETLFSLANYSSFRSAKLSYDQAKIDYRSESASLRKSLYTAFVNLLVSQEQVKVDEKVQKIREENAKLIKLKYESGRESRGNMMYAEALYKQAVLAKQKSDRSLESAKRELLMNMGADLNRDVMVTAQLTVPDKLFTDAELQAAIEDTPQMQSKRNAIKRSREVLATAKSSLYPTLSASQSLSWSGDREFPDRNSWSLGVSLSIPLFSGGITHYFYNVKSAKTSVLAAEENLRDAKLSLDSSIKNAYFGLLNACDTVEAGEGVLKAGEERYKEAQINYMSGNISFIDLETVEQNMVDAQQNQLQYIKNANVQRISLENLLGVTLEK